MATKPRWKLDDALRRARTATRLTNKHSAAVTPRLDAGLVTQLVSDRETLGDATARGAEALTGQKTATKTERTTAEGAHAFVIAIRNAVDRTRGAPPPLRTAVGIGDDLRKTDTQGVVAVLRSVVQNASALAACGVSSDDVTKATTMIADLLGADDTQGQKMDDRADHTEDKNDVQLRLEAAVDQISARGALAFVGDPVLKARFERLVASGGPTPEDEQAAETEPSAGP
ncbi:MAG TPA: hypothetical protein VG389_12090 [Myxococcota bacterium]|jgi:hypothetical protein|nr:hypothetical protein [Myxococcota bacterium]